MQLGSTNTWNAGSATSDYYSAYTYDANGNILSLIRNAENGTGMDSLTYHYQAGTNKLLYVDDDVAASSFTYDIDDQSSGNYTYDKIGNLISDTAEEIGEITWTVYGKIKSITRTSGSKKPNLSFEYTPDGHRVAKHVTDSNDRTTSTWYVRDASGNILSTYTRSWVQAATNASITFVDIYNQLKLDKTYASRIDFLDQNIQWHGNIPSATIDTLETEVLTGHLLDVLENFSIIPFLSTTEIQNLYNTISAYDVIQMLQHSGYQDEYIYDILCPIDFVNLLTAQISQDFFNFLDQLHLLDPTLYDQMCIDLGVPPGTPASTIVSIFTVNDVVAALVSGGGSSNCSVFKTVYDQTIGFNNPTSWGVLSSVAGFNAAIYSHFTLSNLAIMMESYFGYREMWQKYFNVYVGTESTMLHAVRLAHLQSFVYHGFIEINDEAFLSSTVGQLTGQSTETWLNEVESFYGTTYLQELCEAIGYSIDPVWQFALQENHIYGSSRVGLVNRNMALAEQVANSDSFYTYSYSADSIITFYRSQKRYELSNHLGNVLAVITDRRIQSCAGGEVMYYEAQVVSVSDYYPFGSMIQNRSWTAGSGYRFGFQAWEVDIEIKGKGNHISFGDFGYDARSCRRLNTDPKTNKYPNYSPYSAFGNNPVFHIDITGKEFINPYSKIREAYASRLLHQRNNLQNLYSNYGSNVESISRKQFRRSGVQRKQWKNDWRSYKKDISRFNQTSATLRLVQEKEIRTDRLLCDLYENYPTVYNYFNTYTVDRKSIDFSIMNDLMNRDDFLRLSEYGAIVINKEGNPAGAWHSTNDFEKPIQIDNAIPIEVKMLQFGENLKPGEKAPTPLKIMLHELGHVLAETKYKDAVKQYYKNSGIEPDSDGGHGLGNPSGNMADDFESKDQDFAPSTIRPRND